MMDDYKNSDDFQRTEGCKMISPHHSHPTNGVRPSDSNNFTAEWDYHFYRQDTDSNCKPTGSWSHKPGVGPVVHGVVDPESDASIRLYSMHCPFYFCLPCKRNENEEAIDVDRK